MSNLYNNISTSDVKQDEKSIIGDVVRQNNIFVRWAANQSGERKIHNKAIENERKQGIVFSWQSDKTKEMLKGIPTDTISSIPSDINSYEELRATIARLKENAKENEHIENRIGKINSFLLGLGTNLTTDPTNFLTAGFGDAIATTKTFNKAISSYNKAQKTLIGSSIGAGIGYGYAEADQAIDNIDDTKSKLINTAFGGAFGGLAGFLTATKLPITKSHIDNKVTPTEIVSNSLSDGSFKDAVKQVKDTSKTPILKTPIGKAYAPSTRLLSHDNSKVRELATELINPPVAMRDVHTDKVVVSNGTTAQDIKTSLIGEHNDMLRQLNELHTQDKKNGVFNGSYNDYLHEIHKTYLESKHKAQEELWSNIPGEKDLPKLPKDFEIPKGSTEYNERVKLYLKETPLKIAYKHQNPNIAKAASKVADYFNNQAINLKNSGLESMQHIQPNGYLPRSFNVEKMEADKEGFINSLVNAMSKHPANAGVSFKKLTKEAEGVYNKVLDAHYFKNVTEHSNPAISNVKKRNLQYSDYAMYDYLNKDLGLITSKYSRDTAGLIAVKKKLGVSSKSELHNKLKDIFGKDIKPETYKDFEVIFDTLKGTREIPRSHSIWDHTLRIGTKLSRAIFSPGFALSGIAELATPVAVNGFTNTIKAILPGFKTTIDLVRGKSINNPVVKELQQFNLVGKILESRQLNRYDTEDTMHAPLRGFAGKFEETLDKTNHIIHKYMGLGFITEASEITTLVSGMNYLYQMSKRVANKLEIAQHDLKALARLGVSEYDLLQLHDNMKKYGKEKYGQIQELNIDKWEGNIADVITRALERNIKSTILEPDGINLPIWMSDPNSVLARVTMQFTRYPLSAYTQLTMKGIDEVSAKQILSIATNMSILAGVAQIKDLTREKPLYDTNTEEGKKNLYIYVLSNINVTGALVPIMEKILNLAGFSTGQYTPSVSSVIFGPTGAAGQGLQTTFKSLITGDPKIARSINPVEHAWMAGLFMEFLNKTLGDDIQDIGQFHPQPNFTPNVKQTKGL